MGASARRLLLLVRARALAKLHLSTLTPAVVAVSARGVWMSWLHALIVFAVCQSVSFCRARLARRALRASVVDLRALFHLFRFLRRRLVSAAAAIQPHILRSFLDLFDTV